MLITFLVALAFVILTAPAWIFTGLIKGAFTFVVE